MPDQPADQPSDQPADQPSDLPDQPADDSRDPVERPADSPEPFEPPTWTGSSEGGVPFADTLRAKLEEYDVERHLEDFAAQLEHVVRQGVETVGSLAHEHRGDIGGFLSRTAEALDRRTDGRHSETISQVRGQIERGMERLAEHRPDDTGPTEPREPGEGA